MKAPLREPFTAARAWFSRRRATDVGIRVSQYAQCSIRVSDRSRTGSVLELPLEDYVVGAVAAETSADWEDEAIKAIAVACRSFALERITQRRPRRFDVVSGMHDQGFVLPRMASDRVRASVASTTGEYLTSGTRGDGGLRALRSLFHDSCGGGTDAASSVWKRSALELRAVDCGPCARSPRRWTALIEPRELLEAVGLEATVTSPVRMEVVERTPSGRLSVVRVSSADASATVAAEALRAALGYQVVRSARFEWTVSADGIRLDGTGSGHGVGLCKYGACAMATRGSSYAGILEHYYPGHRLVRAGSSR